MTGWLDDVRAHADPHLTCILVGNKIDLCDPAAQRQRQRQVTTEQGAAFAREHGLLFVEASAKSGHNVDRAFEDASRDILDKIQRGVFDDDRVRVTFCKLFQLNERCSVAGCEIVQACAGHQRSKHAGGVLLVMQRGNGKHLVYIYTCMLAGRHGRFAGIRRYI